MGDLEGILAGRVDRRSRARGGSEGCGIGWEAGLVGDALMPP